MSVFDVIVFVFAEDTGDGRETQKRNGIWEAEQVIVYNTEMNVQISSFFPRSVVLQKRAETW